MNSNSIKVYRVLFSVFNNLNSVRKTQILMFFGFISFSAFCETISVASVIPFFDFLLNPGNSFENNLFNSILKNIDFYYPENLILSASALLAVTALIATITKILSLWFGSRLSGLIGVDLSLECFKKTIFRDYEEYLNSNSSELLSTNIIFVNKTVDLLLISSRFLISFISGIFITIFLIIYDTKIAFSLVLIFFLIYFFFSRILRNKLTINSRIIADLSEAQIKIMQETLGVIKEIILQSSYHKYFAKYKNLDKKVRFSIANNEFINLFPRYAIEGIFIILIALMTSFLAISRANFLEIIPVLGIFAIGAQKLIPCMQQCYSGWSYLIGNISSILNVLSIIETSFQEKTDLNGLIMLPFENNLKLINVSYGYNSNSLQILKKVNLIINKGERIGFVGKTGSGKSTLINLIVGLLSPKTGTIEIDGLDVFDKKYSERIFQWRKCIALIPQDTYLKDATIAENIALGLDYRNINFKKLRAVAKDAMIDQFILSKPNDYKSLVGENGIQLSGGQKQRIAIARALYQDSRLIVLDEATSALDIKTEAKIMETIYNLNKNITILIITHRESTISKCDKVFEINNGLVNLRPMNINDEK